MSHVLMFRVFLHSCEIACARKLSAAWHETVPERHAQPSFRARTRARRPQSKRRGPGRRFVLQAGELERARAKRQASNKRASLPVNVLVCVCVQAFYGHSMCAAQSHIWTTRRLMESSATSALESALIGSRFIARKHTRLIAI